MNERHLKETIQKQADTIKELEADFNDEFVKGQMKSKEIEKLNKILYQLIYCLQKILLLS